MNSIKSCFVIIGYGKKASYAGGKVRILDLDETYQLLIKPVFDSLGIECYRAIDKNTNGSIDKLMLSEIKEADMALADISTLNANVMWELGVRHALKSKHTIMICEKEQMGNIPFDINHFIVNQYTHSEEGIPYKEVERFKSELTELIKKLMIQDKGDTDSPVFEFLKDADRHSSTKDETDKAPQKSFSELLKEAEDLKNSKEFLKAKELYLEAKTISETNMSLKNNLVFILSRIVLCTYKSEYPNKLQSLLEADNMLDALSPEMTDDVEILGIHGAIHKRLYEETNEEIYIDKSLESYERGFQMKRDYYNGINTAFILYLKASVLKEKNMDYEDIKIKADYTRNAVLEICLNEESKQGFYDRQDAIWILLTIAEAYNYKNEIEKMNTYEDKATNYNIDKKEMYALNTYLEQKKKIEELQLMLFEINNWPAFKLEKPIDSF